MQAKDYVEVYNEIRSKHPDGLHDDVTALTEIAWRMAGEALEIIKKRRARKPEAITAVFKELDDKFKAVVARLEVDGFLEMLFKHYIALKAPRTAESCGWHDALKDIKESALAEEEQCSKD